MQMSNYCLPATLEALVRGKHEQQEVPDRVSAPEEQKSDASLTRGVCIFLPPQCVTEAQNLKKKQKSA